MKFDKQRSMELATRVGAQPKQCFMNAMRAFHLLGDTARYVEGYVWISNELPIPIEHAWVEDGEVILDVTLWKDAPQGFYASAKYDPTAFVATCDEVATQGRAPQLPLYSNFGFDDWRWQKMNEAQAALLHERMGITLEEVFCKR